VSSADGAVIRKSTVKDILGISAYKNELIFIKADGAITNEAGMNINLGLEGNTIVFSYGPDYALGVHFDRLNGKIEDKT